MASSNTFHPEDAKSEKLERAIEDVVAAASDPLETAFATRALQAVTELTSNLNDDLIGEATSSASDFEVLIDALNALLEQAPAETNSAVLRAKLRGIEGKRELLEAEGGTASSTEIAKLLDITRQAVDKRRRRNQLLAVKTGGREYRYPLWQIADGASLEGLEQVLEALSEEDSWMTLQFFCEKLQGWVTGGH